MLEIILSGEQRVGTEAEELGRAIRDRRRGLGLTLESIGRRTGLSKSFLSQLERGLANPTLLTLIRVASALGSTPTAMLGFARAGRAGREEPPPGLPVRRPALPPQRPAPGEGCSHPLTGDGPGRYQVLLCDGTPAHHRRAVAHPGEEFCFVLSGALRVELGHRSLLLRSGESLHFDAATPHRLVAEAAATRFLLTR
ncbi:XRE family transcriptional regulator [Kitasatospora paranensis]|uniref:Helix-turn-helix domain-containing protein n=1 Tax=Kitasatospora paranensis TaxID=258053 RepID=A0ABW2FVL0_9ACTN